MRPYIRTTAAVLMGLLTFAIAGSHPAGAISSPPVVDAPRSVSQGPLGPTQFADVVGLAFNGTHSVAVWGDFHRLQLERFDPADLDPFGQPVVLDRDSSDEHTVWEQAELSFGFGTDEALVVAKFNDFYSDTAGIRGFLVDADDDVTPVPLGPACPSVGDTTQDRVDVAWNGARFLVAANCEAGGMRVFTVSTAGTVAATAFIPGAGGELATDVSVASAGGAFAIVYEDQTTAELGNVVIRRFNATGAPVGGPQTLDSAVQVTFVATTLGSSGGRYLALWSDLGFDTNIGSFLYRTLTTGGALGAVQRVDDVTQGLLPTLITGPNGSWRLFFREFQDVLGTTIDAALVVGQIRPLLQLGNFAETAAPAGAATADGGAVVAAVDQVPVHRRVSASGGFGVGPQETFGRVPIPQTCQSVARGGNQFLVMWQEVRTPLNPDLFGQRFSASGAPIGGQIPITSASGDQFCPRAAWDGSKWLVAWTDSRNGNKDVFATTVGTNGGVIPSNGFAISARLGSQQSPSVAFNGTDFVVAWNDLRNGNQDVFAARVSPSRVVRDPAGIAVVTATGPQVQPTVSSLGSDTVVGWGTPAGADDDRVGVRVLVPNGTFRTAPLTLATDAFATDISSTATSSRLIVGYRDLGGVSTISVNPTTGAIENVRHIGTSLTLDNLVLAAHGSAITFVASSLFGDELREFVGVLSTNRTSIASRTFLPMIPSPTAIAALPNGNALAAGLDFFSRVAVSSVT